MLLAFFSPYHTAPDEISEKLVHVSLLNSTNLRRTECELRLRGLFRVVCRPKATLYIVFVNFKAAFDGALNFTAPLDRILVKLVQCGVR